MYTSGTLESVEDVCQSMKKSEVFDADIRARIKFPDVQYAVLKMVASSGQAVSEARGHTNLRRYAETIRAVDTVIGVPVESCRRVFGRSCSVPSLLMNEPCSWASQLAQCVFLRGLWAFMGLCAAMVGTGWNEVLWVALLRYRQCNSSCDLLKQSCKILPESAAPRGMGAIRRSLPM